MKIVQCHGFKQRFLEGVGAQTNTSLRSKGKNPSSKEELTITRTHSHDIRSAALISEEEHDSKEQVAELTVIMTLFTSSGQVQTISRQQSKSQPQPSSQDPQNGLCPTATEFEQIYLADVK